MRRLVKKSIMNPEMFKGTLEQLSNQGREILKDIEEYKFKLEQAARITTNDQQITQKIIQKQKQLDVASGQIYAIVFDIENIDITQAYDQQQINTNPNIQTKPEVNVPINKPMNVPINNEQEDIKNVNDLVSEEKDMADEESDEDEEIEVVDEDEEIEEE